MNMKRFATFTLMLSSMASAGLIVLSVWPGSIQNMTYFALFTWIFWFPLVAIAGLVTFVIIIRKSQRTSHVSSSGIKFFLLAGIIGIISIVVVAFSVPRRIVFPLFSSSFQAHVDTAPISSYRGHDLDEQVGVWKVDRYGRDPRGGVYFRTATGPDGLGPDQMSYGFVWKPNQSGSPFGNADYYTARLAGDWYYFKVSNDF